MTSREDPEPYIIDAEASECPLGEETTEISTGASPLSPPVNLTIIDAVLPPSPSEDTVDFEDDAEEEGTEHVSPPSTQPPAAISEDSYLDPSDGAPGFEDDVPAWDIDDDVPEDSEAGMPAEKEMAYR